MKFGDVEAFRAVMRTGSTRKAAASLGVTQPAISIAVRRLEADSGLPLFIRASARLAPTPEAKALLVDIERVFVGMDAVRHRASTLRDTGVDRLELASYPAFGLGFLPRALARLRDASDGNLPHVSLQIQNSRDVLDRVVSGLCDFGLLADELPMSGIDHSVFARAPGVVVMPAGHPLARFRTVKLQHLAQTPFIALNPEDASRRRLERTLQEHGVSLRIAANVPYAATVCELAMSGVGIGLVNRATALDYARLGAVLRPLEVDVDFTCLLAQPAGRPISTVAQRLLVAMRMQWNEDGDRLRALLRAPSA